MNAADLRVQLMEKLAHLGDAELELVNHFLGAITADIVFEPAGEPSWLTGGWFDAFTARLRAHNALSLDPLSTTQFEAAFNSACMAESWPTSPAASATHRFFDTTVIGPDLVERRISLKASSARDMKRDSIHISKLTEAAWIQDARTQAGRRASLVSLFKSYRESTTSIVILRAFRSPGGGDVLYELVEIPTLLFEAVDGLTLVEAQLATIPVPSGRTPPDFKIRIDRSDSKITLTDIRLAVCQVHGRWRLFRPK